MRTIVSGWDGGGTATTCVCLDEQGKLVASKRFGPLNLNGADDRTVSRTVYDALCFMKAQGDCTSLCIGMAGISNPAASTRLRELVKHNGYSGTLTLVGDHEIALRGAVGNEGAVLVSGTGSICYGQNAQGETARVGGGGHLIGDEGSGYAIGRDILIAVLRSLDGRSEPTLLSDGVANELGFATRESIVRYVYHEGRGKADIAKFSKLLTAAYDEGDAAAIHIAKKAASDLCELLVTVSKQLNMPSFHFALMGSVLTHCEPVRTHTLAFVKAALPGAQLIEPIADAATGAALIAKQKQEGQLHA